MTVIVFDLDDTLYLERDFARSGFRHVSRAFADRLGSAERSAELMLHHFDGPNRRRVFDATLESLGRPADAALVGEMVAAYRSHEPAIALLPDAERALARLAGRPSGLISDGDAAMQRRKISALRLAGRVGTMILTGELGPGMGKPHPRAFEELARRAGASAGECVYAWATTSPRISWRWQRAGVADGAGRAAGGNLRRRGGVGGRRAARDNSLAGRAGDRLAVEPAAEVNGRGARPGRISRRSSASRRE
ncbi:MAG: HAD hydrolase-like protein [Phycisphaerae bacterium]